MHIWSSGSDGGHTKQIIQRLIILSEKRKQLEETHIWLPSVPSYEQHEKDGWRVGAKQMVSKSPKQTNSPWGIKNSL